jgi:hypothetical protein
VERPEYQRKPARAAIRFVTADGLDLQLGSCEDGWAFNFALNPEQAAALTHELAGMEAPCGASALTIAICFPSPSSHRSFRSTTESPKHLDAAASLRKSRPRAQAAKLPVLARTRAST